MPCLQEICLLPPAVRLPLGLEHQRLLPRADVFRRRLHREETPSLDRLNRTVDTTLGGI